jgi:hypothetical protein
MSTNARIGMLNPDGSVTSIYLHNDGYPSHVAPILTRHYKTTAKVMELLKLGDLSWLGPQIGKKHDFNTGFAKHREWCLAYGRDRNETGKKAYKSRGVEGFEEIAGGDYAYLWNGKEWLIARATGAPFKKLTSRSA